MSNLNRIAPLLLCLVVPAGMGGAAHAQISSSRSGSSSVDHIGGPEAMSDLIKFGRCYARSSREKALSLIATRPGSREEAQTYVKLFAKSNQLCLEGNSEMNAPLAYVRGVIAEGLFRSGTALPAAYHLPAPSVDKVENLSDAARCYAAGNREQVESLLATTAGSKREYAAVSALMPGLSACLPKGVRAQFDSTLIRFRLAEAMVRLGLVATPPSGS